MSDTLNLITFIDHIGRTTIGELVSSDETTFVVKNPAIIHVQPTPQGQLNVQTIPLYFREFVSDKNKEEGTQWKYSYANTVHGLNVENDQRLVDQYSKLFVDAPLVTPANAGVVKLFDDNE